METLSKLDLFITGYFFKDGHFSTHPFFTFLYNYSEMPAKALAVFGLILFILSFPFKWHQNYRLSFLYLFLTLAVGAFLITELTFKNNWGRPRPRNVIEFEGSQKFRPFYSPQFHVQNKSFPCGHCTAGYYFFSLAFLGKRFANRRIYWWGFLLAFIFGSMIGLARIAQGGHFFTDVIFGGLIMWLTAWGLDRLLFNIEKFSDKDAKKAAI